MLSRRNVYAFESILQNVLDLGKVLLVTPAFHRMAQVFGSLLPRWETWIEFLPLDLVLAQTWLWQSFRTVNQCMENLSLLPSFSTHALSTTLHFK